MKKLKNLFAIMFAITSVLFLASCDKTGTVNYNVETISMEVNETLSLETYVELDSAVLSDVSFTSSASDVVFVKPNNTLEALKNGSAVIQARIGDIRAYLTIIVDSPLQQFEKISGITFDNKTSKLSWNHSYKVESAGTLEQVQASEYTLEITSGETVETVDTVNNYYTFETPGAYSVTIIAKAEGYSNSENSDAFVFNVLQTPQNLEYNKETSELTWDEIEGASYVVSYGEFSVVTDTNSYTNSFSEAGEHSVTVRTKVESDFSKPSQELVITRLESPEVSIVEGVLSFDLAQASLTSKYVVSVTSATQEVFEVDNVTGIYLLDGFSQGTYYIEVIAVGEGEHVLNSQGGQVFEVQKLSSPTITFDEQTRTFSLSDVGATFVIYNTVTEEYEEIELAQETTYTLDKTQGMYEFYAYFPATADDEIKSDYSNKINVKILTSITQLRHTSESDVSTITFVEVSGATGYELYVDGVPQEYTYSVENQLGRYALTSATSQVFDTAKDYQITVVALDETYESQGDDYYLLTDNANNDTLTVKRLANVAINYNGESLLFDWPSIEGASYYEYSVHQGEVLIEEDTTTLLEYSTSSLDFGDYSFRIKAIGNGQTVLDSLSQSQYDFSIKITLNTPQVIFDRETNEIVITPVENAEAYNIMHNAALLTTLQNETYRYYVGDLIDDAGEYVFEIVAKSLSNIADDGGVGNLYSSNPQVVTISKLAKVSSITIDDSFNVSIGNLIDYAGLLSDEMFEIMINEVLVEDITTYDPSLVSTFNLKIKMLATQSVSEPYYINSDYALFEILRYNTPISLDFTDGNLSWLQDQAVADFNISVIVGEENIIKPISQNTVNIDQFATDDIYASMLQGFEFSIITNVTSTTIDEGQTGYINSFMTDYFAVNKLTAPNITTITANTPVYQEEITLNWEAVTNAVEYLVSINSVEQTVVLNTLTFDNLESSYDVEITAKNSSYISSDTITYSLQKLDGISSVDVDENDILTATTMVENASGVMFNSVMNENNNFDLAAILTTGNVEAINIGLGQTQDVFYLNSDPTSYSFTRVANIIHRPVEQNSIQWDVEAQAQEYEIRIQSPSAEELLISVPHMNGEQYVKSYLLNSENILAFATEVGTYTVDVRAIILPQSVDSQTPSALLSGNFNLSQTFDKLTTPQNVAILAEDTPEQINVTVTWDEVLNADRYNVYINGQIYSTAFTNSYTTAALTYESVVTTDGSYSIEIVAEGDDLLSSEASEAVTTQRIAPINADTLYIGETGEFSWAFVEQAEGYAIYYRKEGDVSSSVFEASNVLYDLSAELTQDEFSGNVDFFVLAKGDRTNTLSSEYVFSTKTRLDAPVINLYGDRLTIDESLLEPDATFDVTVKFDDGNSVVEVANVQLEKEEEYIFPDTWMFEGNPITAAGTYIFEAYAKRDDSINSYISTEQIQKADEIPFVGFTRLATTEQDLQLVALASSYNGVAGVQYVLRIEGTDYEDDLTVPNASDELVYPLAGDFGERIPQTNFTISIQVRRDGYLDSNKTLIQGVRLTQINTINGANGVLSWQKTAQTDATGYLLRVLHGEEGAGYFVSEKTTNQTTDDLAGISGTIIANVKVLGNLSVGAYKTQDIVLDSPYRQTIENTGIENLIVEQNFTTTKLENPLSLDVYYGEFQVQMVEGATSYDVKGSNGIVYNLDSSVISDTETHFRGTNEGLYEGVNAILEDTLYTFEVRAISDEEDILYSDFAQSVDVKIIPNANTSVEDLSFAWSDTSVNQVTLAWQQSMINNNYIVRIGLAEMLESPMNMLYARFAFNETEYVMNVDSFLAEERQLDERLVKTNMDLSIRVLGSLTNSEAGGFYYLSSRYSPSMDFVKLQSPKTSVENGRLIWEEVENANGYYIYYMEKTAEEEIIIDTFIIGYTEYQYMQNNLYFDVPESFGNQNQDSTYYFGVRAVNTNQDLMYAPSMVSTAFVELEQGDVDEGEEPTYTEAVLEIIKLKAPKDFNIIDGTLVWKEEGLDYEYTFDILNQTISIDGGSTPYAYKAGYEDLQEQKIVIKLTDDSSGEVNIYTVDAMRMFYAEIVDSPIFDLIAPSLGLSDDFEFGWPVKNFLTSELGETVNPGLQIMEVHQKGNNYDWLDSIKTTGRKIYIPHAPVINLSNHILSWNDVAIPTVEHPYGATYKYTILAEDEFGSRYEVGRTNLLSVDIRDYVNSASLKSGLQKIFVIVSGDDSKYVYGLPSNIIEVTVLPEVSASIEGGVLNWDSVSQAQTYNVILDPDNVAYRFEQQMLNGGWDFADIAALDALDQVLTYNLTIQAVGDGNIIISGMTTDLGQVIKHQTPDMQVTQGILTWDNIVDNDGYIMIVTDELDVQTNIALTIDRDYYESDISGFNNYNLRVVGSTQGGLNTNSQIFAISSPSVSGVNAVMLNSVTQSRAHEGNLLWTNVKELNNTAVTGYKISFDDSNYYDPIYTTEYDLTTIENVQYIVYTIDAQYLAGAYKLYIQPYSTNTYYRAEDGKTYNYLMGGIVEQQSSVEFIKLRNVSEISVSDGVINWLGNDSLSSTYKLAFERGNQRVEFYTTQTSFDPSQLSDADMQLYSEIIVAEQYSVKIQTIGNDTDLISSDEIESLGYRKLNTITNVEYLIDQSGEEGFIIRWNFEEYIGEITDYEYIIKYKNSNSEDYLTIDSREDDSIRRGYEEIADSYYGEIDGSLLMVEGTEQLTFSVAIIPMSSSYVLISEFSEERTVTPPTSLSGVFTYTPESRKISWQYDSNGTDVSFRIIDEIVTIDELNVVSVVDTRVYTSQVKEFIPEVVGMHRISISVMLTGEQVASSYVYFLFDTALEGVVIDESYTVDINGEIQNYSVINFDLFESGDGSSQDPYQIASEEQFKNIVQRNEKPSYLGGESAFSFNQTQNLSVTLTSSIDTFNGVYDGNGSELTWSISTTNESKVGLFKTLGTLGVIKNLVVNASINQEENLTISTIYLSALVADNYGLIEESQVKSFTFTTTMSRGISYYYGSFAAQNYGIIRTSVNTANIVFDGNTNQSSIRDSKLYVGAITYNNAKSITSIISTGSITQTGNTGNITIIAKAVQVGGVAASTHMDSDLQKSYNKGNISVTISASSSSLDNYVGGIVGYNQGLIKNSYNVASYINVDMSNFQRTVYVGGIAGLISGVNGANITNSFTNTSNINITNDSIANVQAALMVGYSQAQDTVVQLTSYYVNAQGMVAINNSPNGFNVSVISSYSTLLTNLNNTFYAFSQGATYPILTWETNFTIV